MLRIFLVLIFAAAAWLRWRMPVLPLGTHDTWGYLYPALSGLAGEGMPETNARGIAYPLFLRLVLGAASSFPAVAVAQHLLGLLSGLFWWLSWNLWAEWLPERLRPAARWCGAMGLLLYLCNANTIFYEATLRPEGVFPFFALAGMTATWMFVRTRWAQPSMAAAWWGALAVLLSLVCLSLKPSWGLAALVPGLLVLAAFAGQCPPWWRGCTAVLCATAAGLWIFLVPLAAQWKPSDTSRLFLPETLFVQHAPAIAATMAARDSRGELDEGEKKFLAKLQPRLDESRTTKLDAFLSLGHNPDYLLYQSDTLSELPGRNDTDARADFLWEAYARAWREQPAAMLAKIATQLAGGFSMAHKSLYAPDMVWRNRVATSAEILRLNNPSVPASEALEDYQLLLSATEEILPGAPEKIRVGPPFMSAVMQTCGSLLVAACMIGWPLLFWRAAISRSGIFAGLATYGIFWALSLGSALTVAVVSSFDIGRYAALQSFLHAFLFSGALLFLAAGTRTLLAGKIPRS